MKEYKKLPELDVLPKKPQDEIDQLRLDLRRGYDPQLKIVIWKGRDVIVDGNHRYDICREEGIEPSFIEEEFEDLDAALCYVWKHYIQCEGRHKTPTQRATGILRYETLSEKISKAAKERMKATQVQDPITGKFSPARPDAANPVETGETAVKLGKIAGTGKTIIKQVLKVKKDGVPELEDMMMSGTLSASAAEDFVKNVPKYEQEKIVKDGVNTVKETVSKIREVEKGAKKFDKFNDPLKEKNERDIEEMRQVQELASKSCLLPNLLEKYCEICQWGFDVYIPSPHETEYCPYCGGKQIVNRKPNWNSRLAVIHNE